MEDEEKINSERSTKRFKSKTMKNNSFIAPINNLDDGCLMHVFSFLSPIPGDYLFLGNYLYLIKKKSSLSYKCLVSLSYIVFVSWMLLAFLEVCLGFLTFVLGVLFIFPIGFCPIHHFFWNLFCTLRGLFIFKKIKQKFYIYAEFQIMGISVVNNCLLILNSCFKNSLC